ncbi:MAG: hypothetical protein ACE5GM_08480 [bacterium]
MLDPLSKAIGCDFREAALWVKEGDFLALVKPCPMGMVELYTSTPAGRPGKLIKKIVSLGYSIRLRQRIFHDWNRELDLIPVLPWHFNLQSIDDIPVSQLIDLDDYMLALLIVYGFHRFKEDLAELKAKYKQGRPRPLGLYIRDQLKFCRTFFLEHNRIFAAAETMYKETNRTDRIPAGELAIHYKYFIEATLMEYLPLMPYFKLPSPRA